MKQHHSLPFISQACRSKAGFFKAGVTTCAITLAIGLPLHPVAAQTGNQATLNLPVDEAPKKLRKEGYRLTEEKVELTDAGKALAKKYAARLAGLQAGIGKELPAVSEGQKQAIRNALAAQKITEVQYDLATRSYKGSYPNRVTALQSAIEKLEDAPVRLTREEMYLKNALAMPDGHADKERALAEARKLVDERRKQLDKFKTEVEKARAAMESAKARYPEDKKKLEAAPQALEADKAKTTQALANAGIHTLLDSTNLEPVEIELKQGRNTLSFHRGHYYMRGITIRDFTLTPVQ